VKDYLQRARAVVCAAEDVGIVPLEAQACGTPVIAFGKGDALETVVPAGEVRATGVYFGSQTAASLIGAIERFERLREHITAAACRANAERFAPAVFRRAFMAEVTRSIAAAGMRQPVEAGERVSAAWQPGMSAESAKRHPEAAGGADALTRGTSDF
jgi:hypothetical protein